MLSIIIITKNEEARLPALLESIKGQDYKGYEIIVSDAKSTDSTRKIAKRFGCKVVDGGLPAAGRNRGADAAKGDMLLFLDADTVLPENFIKNNVSEFKNRKLSTASCYLSPRERSAKSAVYTWFANGFFRVMQFFSPNIFGLCIFSTKRTHRKLGGFDETLLFAEDNDYVSRSRRFGRFRMLGSVRIIFSTRRLEEHGYISTTFKYTKAFFYRIFIGEIRRKVIEYEFDSYKKG